MSCSTCGAKVAKDARFCSSCGTRLDSGETVAVELPPSEPGPAPVNYVHAEPRLFGVVPPVLALVLAAILAAVAIAMLVSGNWIFALLVVAVAALLFTLFLGAARHAPASPFAKKALAATDHVTSWAGFAGGSAGAWSAAGRDVLRLRNEIRALRPQRDDVQFALGDAAYRENASETASLRARLRDLDREITERETASAAALERARKRSRRERQAIQPTERLEAVEGGSGDPPGEDV